MAGRDKYCLKLVSISAPSDGDAYDSYECTERSVSEG